VTQRKSTEVITWATAESAATAKAAGLLWDASKSRDVSNNGTPQQQRRKQLFWPQKCRLSFKKKNQIKIEKLGDINFGQPDNNFWRDNLWGARKFIVYRKCAVEDPILF